MIYQPGQNPNGNKLTADRLNYGENSGKKFLTSLEIAEKPVKITVAV